MTKVVNKNHHPYDVNICRPSEWGNPFIIGVHGNRHEVIRKYEDYVTNNPDLMGKLPSLQGKVLGCVCKPKACHGDVLVRMLKEMNQQPTLFARLS